MTHRYYDLVSASVEIDTSGLQEKLDELENFDASELEDRISALEGLNTCNVDVNDLADVPNRVDVLESTVEGFADLDSRISTLEGLEPSTVFTDLRAQVETLQADVMRLQNRNAELERNLGEWRAEDFAALGERIERLEATTSTSANFFALAGKLLSLLLNARS